MRQLLFLALLCPFLSMCQPITLKGKIINEQMEPIAGATITLKRSTNNQPSSVITQLSSDTKGEFTMTNIFLTDTLIITAIGYETAIETLDFNSRGLITIILKRRTALLDEAVIIAYGTTTRRLNTGSVSRVTSEEISRQPVSNPLSALSGRVPGLIVTETSGVPGAALKLQLRGRSSIAQGTDPLFIIDGVPFAPNNTSLAQLGSVATSDGASGISPFSSLNPADIESIEVLKDADATAIYGSRGANGVVLISTKKGKAGPTKVSLNAGSGFSRTTKAPVMMTTAQYLDMRREAFANDGVVPTAVTAPDLLVWDTTRYTNFGKLLMNGTARFSRAQATLSGGAANTQFLLGTGYQHQSVVFPGNMQDNKGSLHFNISHDAGKKFGVTLSGSYASEANSLVSANPAGSINLPPNTPPLYDGAGKLNWQAGGVAFTNPMAYLLYGYRAKTENLLGNLQLSYALFKGFNLKTSLGYHSLYFTERSATPRAALDPAIAATGSSQFGNRYFKSWIMEPQATYSTGLAKGRLEVLIGASWQQTLDTRDQVMATGYTNDALLGSMAGASTYTIINGYTQYRYQALFSRLHYSWQQKYILNLSGRRDGSSRFGPRSQFAGFGAAGMAWVFSNEKWIQKDLPFLSYGKLRGSYGISGNDQIGDYQYLDSWKSTQQPYNSLPGLTPTALFNAHYRWEVNRKWEGALELGFLKDRLLLSLAFFRNRSGNQLVQYALPSQTGFASIIQNFPALVENRGWEFTLNTQNLNGKLQWSSAINLTLHRNKLLAFPGIETSSYAATYLVGQPLNLIYAYHFTGVDPATGLFSFEDLNKDGMLNSADRTVSGSLDPQYYGGLANTLSLKGWQLDVFCAFSRQKGRNYLYSVFGFYPGSSRVNQPVFLVDRWQKPGDVSTIQMFTASASSPAAKAWTTLGQSDGIYSDASFIRIKNLALSRNLPSAWIKKIRAQNLRLYVQAQNLFTITGYKGADPENQNLFALPPLKTWVVGVEFTF